MTKEQRRKWRDAVEAYALQYPCESCGRNPGWRCADRHGSERNAHTQRFRTAARFLPASLDPTANPEHLP